MQARHWQKVWHIFDCHKLGLQIIYHNNYIGENCSCHARTTNFIYNVVIIWIYSKCIEFPPRNEHFTNLGN